MFSIIQVNAAMLYIVTATDVTRVGAAPSCPSAVLSHAHAIKQLHSQLEQLSLSASHIRAIGGVAYRIARRIAFPMNEREFLQ